MKIFKTLIHSNIFISLGAVLLTIETQIQLGMEPQWQPYLILIFFATLFEYNLHRLITVISFREAGQSNKHNWVKNNSLLFYFLVAASVIGLTWSAIVTDKEILLVLAPVGMLTLLYSIPVFGNKRKLFRIREIPYLKIFVIALVWSLSTILVPLIQSETTYSKPHLLAMFMERFFFIIAITIPFDIRDIEADKNAGLKTLPLLLNENKSITFAKFSLLLFFVISCFHYSELNSIFLLVAMSISAISTFIFIHSKSIRNLPYYHYGILDGTMLLQGILVWGFFLLK